MSVQTQDAIGLQVVVAHGPKDAERALLALNAALVAASSGVEATVFFTLRGTHWACARAALGPATEEIDAAIQGLQEAGAHFECCSACLDRYCMDTGSAGGLRPGIKIAGLATLVQRAAGGVPTLSF